MKKKILYVHHGKGLGGAPLSLLYLIQGLDKNKFEPIVLFLHHSEAVDLYKEKKIKIAGVVGDLDFPHSKIRWYRWYHPHLFLKTLKGTLKTLFFSANYWLDKIKPDLIHLNTSSLSAWAKVAKKKGVPVVWHVREPLADGYFGFRKFLVTSFVKKYSSAILPICKNDAKPWLNNKKVSVLYNTVDSKKFNKDLSSYFFLKKYNLSSYSPKILFLGGLSKEKGTLEILKIFKKLLERLPDAKLVVAGYFDLNFKSKLSIKYYSPMEEYKREVKQVLKDIKKDIIFTGPINNVELAMAACNVVVFPATVGHFARPVIEAGFMSKPVVASNVPPLNELVLDNKTGCLVDIKNHDLWVEKLNKLLVDQNLNVFSGKNAHAYCIEKFSIKKQVNIVQNIYKESFIKTKILKRS